jgi:hypothetical protein
MTMANEPKLCWRNCAVETDAEIVEIDALEDRIGPVDADTRKIRDLISSLELCHHKAERWVESIIEAIAAGKTNKGLGTRPSGQVHPAETTWQNACAALSNWCEGCAVDSVKLMVGPVAASELLAGLGKSSPLKRWQVQRLIERIRSLIGWPQSDADPATQYEWLLIGGGEYDLAYRSDCPERYAEHEDFWRTTARTIIHDTASGRDAELSLALAIDLLWPCHWRFVENLRIVLNAIGGDLYPSKPFAACGRNITLVPNRERLETIARTLRAFCGVAPTEAETDRQLLSTLGDVTDAKWWLAMSLAKTITLQLNPSADMQAASALDGPAWIRE